MAIGDYQKTTYNNGAAPGISAQRLNNNEDKTAELDQAVNTHLADDASTTTKGHVQLTDSVTSSSTTTAATPKNVKAAYDLANAAVPKSGGVTLTGKIIAQNNTDYTKQIRNTALSLSDPSGGGNGDVWIKYK